jgi:hypothetical protein
MCGAMAGARRNYKFELPLDMNLHSCQTESVWQELVVHIRFRNSQVGTWSTAVTTQAFAHQPPHILRVWSVGTHEGRIRYVGHMHTCTVPGWHAGEKNHVLMRSEAVRRRPDPPRPFIANELCLLRLVCKAFRSDLIRPDHL